MERFSYETVDALKELIPEIWEEIKDFSVVLLSGNLGSGKTTLIQQLGKYLNIEDDINSPTFALINEYRDKDGKTYYHMDMYRLETLQEAADLGLEDIVYGEDKCFIEWPELIMDLLPSKFVHLKITHSELKRDLEIEKHG